MVDVSKLKKGDNIQWKSFDGAVYQGCVKNVVGYSVELTERVDGRIYIQGYELIDNNEKKEQPLEKEIVYETTQNNEPTSKIYNPNEYANFTKYEEKKKLDNTPPTFKQFARIFNIMYKHRDEQICEMGSCVEERVYNFVIKHWKEYE